MVYYMHCMYLLNYGLIMTSEEYKAARGELGLSVPEWIERLGISRDTHKKYNSAAMAIQLPVSNHIQTLLELNRLKKSVSNALK
jgi:predicted transcriptional regulator